jgi:diguanylate cyclase (GGDEF)-like protein
VDAVARAHDQALDGAARLALAAAERLLILTVFLGGLTALVAARRVATIMQAVNRTAADLRESEARIRHLAHVDEVTRLPNRNRFREYLGEVIAGAEEEPVQFSLMFIDLDGFKAVNDSLSHTAGDELLALVSVRLDALVRRGDMVARLGGDEFVVLVLGIGGEEQPAAVAGRILAAVSEPYEVAGVECHVTASIGITVFPEHGRDAQTLLRKADLAMYEAKRLGKNGFVHFSARAEGRVRERVSIESALRRALPRGELSLVYQPVVDLSTMRAGSAEALLRWRHPVLGDVPPSRFIPVAEESGLILEIGNWVIGEACRQAASWRRAGAGDVQVAVNVTHHQLLSDDFHGQVCQALAAHGLPGGALVLEITESTLMEQEDDTLARLRHLVALGVEFALDDFGTGYSSLSRLHTLPISAVKIDRSFLSTDRDEHRAIVLTILGLARILGLRVVAEGVEDESCGIFLADGGCAYAQGYYFSRPVDAASIDWDTDYSLRFHPESDLRRLMRA